MSRTRISYAHGIESRWRRVLVRGMESVTGGRRLKRLYDQSETLIGEDVWADAVRALELQLVVHGRPSEEIPKEGPLVVVANHPFGVIDGIVLCYLVSRARPDFRILINHVLERIEEIRPWLLPIDFRETKEAVQTNLRSRSEARKYLRDGGAVLVFPSGGVSTAMKPFGPALDTEWKAFTGTLVRAAKSDVLPVYFHGQNSRLFQWASRVSPTLRLSLLVNEVRNKMGRSLSVTIGNTLPYAELEPYHDRSELMNRLRHETYSLAWPEHSAGLPIDGAVLPDPLPTKPR